MAKVQNGSVVKANYYDAAGHMIAETDGSGALQRAEIFAGGRHLATWSGNATYFNLADWLGTERARSNSTGMLCETITSLPFGDGEVTNGTCSPTPVFFTGLERDTESGLDHTLNRQYPSNLGRWLTPDPGGVKAVTLADPQTWNMYDYVRNNPTTLTDPSGLDWAAYEIPDRLDAAIGSAVNYVTSRAVNSGSPAEAAVGSFAAGVTGAVAEGFTNLLRVGQSVSSLPENASGSQIATAVAEEGGRVGGIILTVVAVAGPKTPATAEQGASVAREIGRNRAILDNGSQVDLAGKTHFEKSTGEFVPTPHIKDGTLHTGPGGTSVTYGPTRPATVGDVNAAAKAAGASPAVRIPPPLPVPRKCAGSTGNGVPCR